MERERDPYNRHLAVVVTISGSFKGENAKEEK